MKDSFAYTISNAAPLRGVIEVIDRGAAQIALAVDVRRSRVPVPLTPF